MSWPCAWSSRKVGTENSGVPMKINRSGMSPIRVVVAKVRPLAKLGRLGEFLDDAIALELGDVIDEQHAVEVVDLVLDAGGEQAPGFDLVRLAVEVEVANLHLRRPRHLLVVFRDRE